MGEHGILQWHLSKMTFSRMRSFSHFIVGALFSFEMFFALFLFAGVFKENPRLSWIPFDLTIVGFLVSVILGLGILFKQYWTLNLSTFKKLAFPVLFFLWAILSLKWSNCWEYGGRKALQLFLIGFWGFAGSALIIGGDENRFKKFCGAILFFSAWMVIEFVGLLTSENILEEWDFSSNYLGFGRLVGLSVIVMVGMLIWGRFGRVVKGMLGLVSAFYISILMISGGRGPLLATLAAMIVPLVRDIRFLKTGLVVKRGVAAFAALLGLVLVGFIKVGNRFFGFTTIDRLWGLLEAGGGDSAQRRLWFFEKSWDLFFENPLLGHGMGSFGYLIGWGDVRIYPHNIVLETMVELGLVGLVLLMAVVFSSLKGFSMKLLRLDILSALMIMFLVNSFFNASVSGDLPDNRLFFAFLGLCAGRFQMVANVEKNKG